MAFAPDIGRRNGQSVVRSASVRRSARSIQNESGLRGRQGVSFVTSAWVQLDWDFFEFAVLTLLMPHRIHHTSSPARNCHARTKLLSFSAHRILGCALVFSLVITESPDAATRWNIISIVTDDQAEWAVGAYGNREVLTPHMDSLARDGARFLNAFVTAPVCSRSRASFLTGQYPTQAGITDWIAPLEASHGLGLPVRLDRRPSSVAGGKTHPYGSLTQALVGRFLDG
jgi:hypothetical protein